MTLPEIYLIWASIGGVGMLIEAIIMVREGMVVLRKRSARNWSRLAKMGKVAVLLVFQCPPLILAVYLGSGSWWAVVYTLPIAALYCWHVYLACKWKTGTGKWTWPKLTVIG